MDEITNFVHSLRIISGMNYSRHSGPISPGGSQVEHQLHTLEEKNSEYRRLSNLITSEAQSDEIVANFSNRDLRMHFHALLGTMHASDLEEIVSLLGSKLEWLTGTKNWASNLSPSPGMPSLPTWNHIYQTLNDRVVLLLDIVDHIETSLSTTIPLRICRPSVSEQAHDMWKAKTGDEHITTDAKRITELIEQMAEMNNTDAILPVSRVSAVVAHWTLLTNDSMKLTFSPEDLPILQNPKPQPRRSTKKTAYGKFPRRRVPKTELYQGGRYRGVCLLRVAYRNDGESFNMNATGWLVDKSTVVTIAHALYDSSNNTHAYAVKAYVGVMGSKSDKAVDKGQGVAVAIHWDYYKSATVQNDIAVIKLKQPLLSGQPFCWKITPMIGNQESLRQVGYAGDLPSRAYRKCHVMYESEGPTTYDLSLDRWLLKHHLHSYEGNSGSPILSVEHETGKLTVIGVLAYGSILGRRGNDYFGSVLGHMSNDIDAFSKAITAAKADSLSTQANSVLIEVEQASTIPGLKKITVQCTASTS
ncbi:MAG: hypothetical protein M1814_001964 [Vezdaea aestivalis]|nr:MAG: hypothetical protein M1814_001964 [Vezdaea aestivalis]